ncbi:MAG: putative transferase transmembrane protein [Candidatus Collierbacteria bacterium GW2011_GWC2_44_18]|uniref:Putative transferase transmembrane protein n=2 Tax=Microgenomates group TaxID=1794810 RepID=A0A0G1J7Z3_9BACT|nr:MAG: putative transferase transmembrane protein [Candidatus Collierbacteria bacterium GW2011_GWC2_44_18]KKT67493.1 MAG: putative transferase transmembrane protein [Candidatus Woesebacteria bacterium GW2011_GWA2_44_33]
MQNTDNGRITKLDGLRGLLSLVVALNHSFLVVAIPAYANVWGQNYLVFQNLQAKIQQLIMLIGNGGAAVTMFFLLSGLVLGQSMSRVEFSFKGLLSFYTKRILRLYPVYIFIILITAIYMRVGFRYQMFPFASDWYLWWMNFQMTIKELIYNFFFIHVYLGGVTWTLRVILIASFIFPVFYQISKKPGRLTSLILSLFLIIASFTIFDINGFRDLRYLYMFYLGLILPKFKSLFVAIPSWIIYSLVPFSLILLLAIRYTTDEYFGGLVESIISWFIIGIIVYNGKTKIFDFLNQKTFLFFGKISYSLYLVHFTVLYILARLMFSWLPNLPYSGSYLPIHMALFVLSLFIATLVSLFVHHYIEIPSLQMGNAINRKLQKS